MAIYYSFHYEKDAWRVNQIRNAGIIDGEDFIKSQSWESVKQSDTEIKNWIDSQMKYKRAVVVLIGSETAYRKWVKYEINRAIELKKPLIGIEIHGLKDKDGFSSRKGENPFIMLGYNQVPVFSPLGFDSKSIYNSIKQNLSTWIERGYVKY